MEDTPHSTSPEAYVIGITFGLATREEINEIVGVMERLTTCCEEVLQISINEAKTFDGACYLELNVPPRSRLQEGFWDFLQKYGFRYGDMYTHSRPLLPSEAIAILRKLPKETVKKLSAKGFFPQEGYILQHLPVPPNCLFVPDVSDGISTMSLDHSIALLKKVVRVVEIRKNSRSGKPNFESQEIESNDLQAAVTHYSEFRGTGKATQDVDNLFGVHKEINVSSTKASLEKMKTLFIRKGSGFSCSVITGDPFKGVSEIGLPFEIDQKITFEERVNQHNMEFLYRDGVSTYSLREGSKGHTFLRPGQVVHRRIMDGDTVFINRPPTTHKHSVQALSVYVHDDHTVKINPLICGPLSADFDGDRIHLFYPQSLEAKAEVVELFAVEKQLLSSHTGNFNLQLSTDSLLSLKTLFRRYFLSKAGAQQLAMFVPNVISKHAVLNSKSGPLWTASQVLQMTLPPTFDCSGERHVISNTEVLSLDFNRDVMRPISNNIVTSLFFMKGPNEVLRFFNSIQPLLMESIYSEGFSVSLRDFFLQRDVLESIQEYIQKIYPLLSDALQLDSYLCSVKIPVANFILKSSRIGHLIDSKSESALNKVVQQIGFLGIQLSDKGKFYSEMLVKEMSLMFQKRYPSCDYHRAHPAEEFGLVGKTLFRGLDPYQEMVHSISSREIIVRSTQGLTEPGTLFKNLMAILRDVVICFEYGVNSANTTSEFCAGDQLATSMSNPAYKAVLDSSASSNSSWEMMKEILLCGVTYRNDIYDRQLRLFLNSCDCGRKHCQENAALVVKNHLKKVSLKDTAIDFLIEYSSQMVCGTHEVNPGPVGHIHLNKSQLVQSSISMHDIFEKCEETISLHENNKKVGGMFRNVVLNFSECCSFCQSSKSKWTDVPCIQIHWREARVDLERACELLDDKVCSVLLDTIIKGDDRVASANIVWISPHKATWAMGPSGDAWRVLMDSCLPIIHIIDTKRSITYAIIQVLLGISCAFEQAVQRLSTSLTMVIEGVLKDHLLLLANSMTCAGSFIGFNAGGIKSLSKSLGVQVPFMNATLFTPRKCLERAAEKCHVDNLSSIVASCAWGKHVTVGTGSPFQILWDTRKAELSTNKEIDAYSFLHLVSSGSKPDDIGTSCLDDLDQHDYMDSKLSRVGESDIEKPTFDNAVELGLNGDDNDGFSKEDSWLSVGTTAEEGSGWGEKAVSDGGGSDGGGAWGNKVDSDGGGAWGKKVGSDGRGAWGKKADSDGGGAWGEKADSDGGGAWGKKADSDVGVAWGKKAKESTRSKTGGQSTFAEEGSAWGKKAADAGGAWGPSRDGPIRDGFVHGGSGGRGGGPGHGVPNAGGGHLPPRVGPEFIGEVRVFDVFVEHRNCIKKLAAEVKDYMKEQKGVIRVKLSNEKEIEVVTTIERDDGDFEYFYVRLIKESNPNNLVLWVSFKTFYLNGFRTWREGKFVGKWYELGNTNENGELLDKDGNVCLHHKIPGSILLNIGEKYTDMFDHISKFRYSNKDRRWETNKFHVNLFVGKKFLVASLDHLVDKKFDGEKKKPLTALCLMRLSSILLESLRFNKVLNRMNRIFGCRKKKTKNILGHFRFTHFQLGRLKRKSKRKPKRKPNIFGSESHALTTMWGYFSFLFYFVQERGEGYEKFDELRNYLLYYKPSWKTDVIVRLILEEINILILKEDKKGKRRARARNFSDFMEGFEVLMGSRNLIPPSELN